MPLAEHDLEREKAARLEAVSIHVPLAEHDMSCARRFARCLVSIHVPLAEHDTTRRRHRRQRGQFQFTCPSRSTTVIFSPVSGALGVSIHVPLAEHDLVAAGGISDRIVSIHVPLAEHDV